MKYWFYKNDKLMNTDLQSPLSIKEIADYLLKEEVLGVDEYKQSNHNSENLYFLVQQACNASKNKETRYELEEAVYYVVVDEDNPYGCDGGSYSFAEVCVIAWKYYRKTIKIIDKDNGVSLGYINLDADGNWRSNQCRYQSNPLSREKRIQILLYEQNKPNTKLNREIAERDLYSFSNKVCIYEENDFVTFLSSYIDENLLPETKEEKQEQMEKFKKMIEEHDARYVDGDWRVVRYIDKKYYYLEFFG